MKKRSCLFLRNKTIIDINKRRGSILGVFFVPRTVGPAAIRRFISVIPVLYPLSLTVDCKSDGYTSFHPNNPRPKSHQSQPCFPFSLTVDCKSDGYNLIAFSLMFSFSRSHSHSRSHYLAPRPNDRVRRASPLNPRSLFLFPISLKL